MQESYRFDSNKTDKTTRGSQRYGGGKFGGVNVASPEIPHGAPVAWKAENATEECPTCKGVGVMKRSGAICEDCDGIGRIDIGTKNNGKDLRKGDTVLTDDGHEGVLISRQAAVFEGDVGKWTIRSKSGKTWEEYSSRLTKISK